MNIENLKSKIMIGIPSLGRHEYITKKTMNFCKNLPIEVKVFVDPLEYTLYCQTCGKENVVKLPESRKRIMYSLNHIRSYAKEKGYQYLFQIDDDVQGFERVDTKDKVEALMLTIQDCIEAMERFPQLGGIRFTQYRYWIYSKKGIHKWTHINPLMQGVCVIRLDAINEINPILSEFTDTITTLNVWRNGYFTLNYGLSGLNVVQNANKGGCQSYDRREDAIRTIENLKIDFPKVTQKEGSSYFKIDVDASAYIQENHYSPINLDSNDELENYLIENQVIINKI
jgi:hypothetical protein